MIRSRWSQPTVPKRKLRRLKDENAELRSALVPFAMVFEACRGRISPQEQHVNLEGAGGRVYPPIKLMDALKRAHSLITKKD